MIRPGFSVPELGVRCEDALLLRMRCTSRDVSCETVSHVSCVARAVVRTTSSPGATPQTTPFLFVGNGVFWPVPFGMRSI